MGRCSLQRQICECEFSEGCWRSGGSHKRHVTWPLLLLCPLLHNLWEGMPWCRGEGETQGLWPSSLPPIHPLPLVPESQPGREERGGLFWKECDYDNKSFFALSFILHLYLISFFGFFGICTSSSCFHNKYTFVVASEAILELCVLRIQRFKGPIYINLYPIKVSLYI